MTRPADRNVDPRVARQFSSLWIRTKPKKLEFPRRNSF